MTKSMAGQRIAQDVLEGRTTKDEQSPTELTLSRAEVKQLCAADLVRRATQHDKIPLTLFYLCDAERLLQ